MPKRKTMILAFGVLVVAILLGAAGQIALKLGVNQLPPKSAPLTVLASVLTQRWVLIGFLFYGLSSLVYLLALSRLELSYAYPMVALSYVVVTFASWKLLGETVPPMRIAGLGVVCVGVVLLALSYRGTMPSASASASPPAVVAPLEHGGPR